MKICVPIVEANVADAIAAVEKAKDMGADIVELRLDYLGSPTEEAVVQIIQAVDIPKIATLRPEKQGGFYKGDENTRINLLQSAMNAGVQYLDLEVTTDVGWRYEIGKACRNKGAKLIISFHDFQSTPDKQALIDIVKNEYAAGADIAKIATTPRDFEDVLTVLSVVNKFKTEGKDIIGVSMGKLGKISRILAGPVGSFLTYAALDENKASAEGQLTITEIKTIMSILNKH